MHQHTPLKDIMFKVLHQPHLVAQYLRYKAHVCREVYEDPETWAKELQLDTEQAWPEYKDDTYLTSRPAHWSSDMGPKEWRDEHLGTHVEKVMRLKQHHVHVLNTPLSQCRRPDNPNRCKGDFLGLIGW